tara:strand:- start:207 stop:749 length:543 start_codon:yes stop_codon:yes gene_type:complete
MEVIKTSIDGLLLFKPNIIYDDRGYFMQSFEKKYFEKILNNINFIQDNESQAKRGVLRGLHFQNTPFEQSKLVRVIYGKVQDVVVDLRRGSPTFGKYESFILSSTNKNQLFIPKGFAHGFLTLSEEAIFSYKIDNKYSPDHEVGIRYNDPVLKIKWDLPHKKIILSEKDKKLPGIDLNSL